MSKIYGPTPEEAIHGCYAASAAEAFLDAYLNGRIEAMHVKELACALGDFHAAMPRMDFNRRAEDFDAIENWMTGEAEVE